MDTDLRRNVSTKISTENCELCNGTGFIGDNGPGQSNCGLNHEFMKCECKEIDPPASRKLYPNLTISGLRAIIFYLREGFDNGKVSKNALAEVLEKSVIPEIEKLVELEQKNTEISSKLQELTDILSSLKLLGLTADKIFCCIEEDLHRNLKKDARSHLNFVDILLSKNS